MVAPVNAIPIVDVTGSGGSATKSGRAALPIKVVASGSMPLAPGQPQAVVFVTSPPFPAAPVQTVPAIIVASPAGPFTEIPVFNGP